MATKSSGCARGCCYELSGKPYSGRRRIAIIDDADYLAVGQKESANCLLKTLEEPPPKSILILIGTSEQRQLRDDPLAVPDRAVCPAGDKRRGGDSGGAGHLPRTLRPPRALPA